MQRLVSVKDLLPNSKPSDQDAEHCACSVSFHLVSQTSMSNSIPKAFQLSPLTSLIHVDNPTKVHRLSWQTALYTFSSSNASFIFSNRRYDHLKARAASVPESADEASKQSGLVKTLQLGSMFGIWYLLNIYFNIYNKQVLKVYPFPATVTAFQFGCGTVMIILMWATRSQQFCRWLWHTVGNLLTNISLGKVAVSFTHTIKAMEPLFTVVFSALLLAERPSIWVVSSLVPIVGGVALASFTEASFKWFYSFLPALCCKPRIEYQKVMLKITSGWLLLPPLPAGGTPVTHAVGNCVKRVVVIVSSVVFFQTTVSPIYALGTAFALAGVFLYSRAKRLEPKPN